VQPVVGHAHKAAPKADSAQRIGYAGCAGHVADEARWPAAVADPQLAADVRPRRAKYTWSPTAETPGSELAEPSDVPSGSCPRWCHR
jgi:hypothetical protein